MEENNLNLPNMNMQSQKSNNEIQQDNSNKEKINYKIVFAIAIPVSIILSIIIIMIYIMIGGNSNETSWSLDLAHNGQFTGYFGDKVSSSDVKALLSLVRSNNISQTAGEIETIAINFIQGTGSGTIMAPPAVSRAVISGKTYWVGTENENACKKDTDPTEGNNAEKDSSAYYSNGKLRIITIRENI